MANGRNDELLIGVDVGSTTVKATVVDPVTRKILWSDYQRHQTKQPEKVLEFLVRIGNEFPKVPREKIGIFITGSGGKPIAEHIGARFVQEVNSVTMAVEDLHPDVGSVVELGGQDAKIIIFRSAGDAQKSDDAEDGAKAEGAGKTAQTSMNDKCASGTGATIDKCMIKVGLPEAEVAKIPWDDSKLHHVAAKCGVFAETDIVNLVKTGIPSLEIMNSLADAIVMQNLSVLTRGNTLKHKVLLLGGPNTYLPFLQACWRQRIPQTWDERGYQYPKDVPIEELIFVPENAQYYAAYGACLYGMHEPAHIGIYTGIDGLREFITSGRKSKLGEAAGPGLAANVDEVKDFTDHYRIPKFVNAVFQSGQHVRAVIGLDGGSTSSKCVLVDEAGTILLKEYQLSRGNPIADMKEMLASVKRRVTDQGATLEVIGFGATGYAADVLEKSLKADVNIVETVAHMMSAVHFFGDVDVICDIGGQDIKVLFMQNGDIKNFRLSNQCSAGNGMLLQAMADQFGVDVREYADTAFQATLSPKFSYGCAVFLDSDRVNFQKEGYSKEELLAGLALVLPKNVWQYVVQVPRMAELGKKFVLQGGTQHNMAAVKAQVDYIKARVPGAEVFVHPHTGEAGAIGAAMETLRVVKRRGSSTFIGLDAAININYTTKNDEETRCHFCPNLCARTFIDTEAPDGSTSRYIAGFSCEKGTVESEEAMLALTKERKVVKKKYPNLVEYEAKRAFAHFYTPEPLPGAGSTVHDVRWEEQGLVFKKRVKVPYTRGFERSSPESLATRQKLRIGLVRVLNMYSTGPFWRTYFESLGILKHNVVWSDATSEEMWQEGGKYGSIDPCYPSKVAQAHVHNLLFHHHSEEKPLDYIYFPIITNLDPILTKVMDTATCPIVSGAPEVIKAAFTKEVDFFATRGITYVDNSCSFTEPTLLKLQMFEAWGPRLGVTEDESDFAVDQAWKAFHAFESDVQQKGKDILEQVEREDRIAILLVGRPYHSDPGLSHSIPDEFQILGFPVLSMRSIPKDPKWLERFFKSDLESGRISSPLEITDVWPENYSSNSAQKVWSVKFAARHPNVAVLDLSSFKCGHDAPTYGIIDGIVREAGSPYSALHDIDANKPGGSLKIRVRTYAHSLELHKERLEDLSDKKQELAYRIDQKRLELLELKKRQLRDIAPIAAEIEAVKARMATYETRQEAVAEPLPGQPKLVQLRLSKHGGSQPSSVEA